MSTNIDTTRKKDTLLNIGKDLRLISTANIRSKACLEGTL